MSQEWKLVPVRPTEEMLIAGYATVHPDQLLVSAYQAMLAAAPVPPAGEEVEVLGWLAADKLMPTQQDAREYAGYRGQDDIKELVDRAHVTRLQAENAALQQRLNVADQQVDGLESDIARARELVRWLYTHANVHQVGTIMMDAARDFMAHQSAPAAKLSDVAHDRAYRNGLMAGFGMGLNGNEAAYKRALIGYQREIVEAVQSAPAAKGESDE